jgi:hypothetical protein
MAVHHSVDARFDAILIMTERRVLLINMNGNWISSNEL